MSEYYQSPFSWRYASPKMRRIWGEENKRKIWRQLWVYLAEVQSGFGLVTQDQVMDLKKHASEVDIQKSLEVEAQIQHDLMAEVKVFADQCPVGGKIIHWGATSMDVKDNAEVLQICQSLDVILDNTTALLLVLANKIEQYSGMACIAFTHLQPAEPTTLGYRLSNYAQDILEDFLSLKKLRSELKGKGFKGAVGTAASYIEILGKEDFIVFENRLSDLLGIPFFDVATQTYPRKQDYHLISALANLGLSLYKLSFDLRLLQSQPFGEIMEPFGEKQIGSSAMPFKRNPINAEKITSLTRLLSTMPQTAWNNAAHSLLERTLDDSANRRSLIPEAFLICDETTLAMTKILKGLVVNEQTIQRNLSTYGPFAATERVLMALVRAGANRQEMHEKLRELSMDCWRTIEQGHSNNLSEQVANDPEFQRFLSAKQLNQLMDANDYVGLAPEKAQDMAQKIHRAIE